MTTKTIIDLDQAHRFLTLLAGSDPVTFQTFDDGAEKNSLLAKILHGTLPEHADTLGQLNAQGAGVFAMINQGDLKGRKAENVIAIRAAFVDLDDARLEPVLASGLEPHVTVESSPGRYHAYWLTKDCPLKQFGLLQAALATRFDGDKSVKDLPRVMRLAGFFHRKGDPFQTHILSGNSFDPYAVADLIERLELDLSPTAPVVTRPASVDGLIPEGARNSTLMSLAGSMRRKGMSPDAILAALFIENTERCEPSLPESEIRNIATSISRYMPDETASRPTYHHKEAAPVSVLPQPSIVQIVCASDIKPEPIRWLWDGWLAKGKFHIFAGMAGTGKTTIAIALGATISIGGRFPDGTNAPVGNVLIWSGEDSAKDTLIPRLMAAGANLSRVHFIGDVRHGDEVRSFDPATDIAALNAAAALIGNISLLIVDPVVNAVAGDSHKNGEVRRALQPLVDFGEKLDCAVLGISHFSKGTGGKDPMERVTGSLAFAALARIVLATAKIAEGDATKRIFCRAKSNIGLDHGGFEYDLLQKEIEGHSGLFSSYSVWGQAVEGSARELLAENESNKDDGEAAGAEQFLREILANGPIQKNEIEMDCRGAGISVATLRRAKKRLGIISKKDGMKGVWSWSLPDEVSEDAHKDAEDAHVILLSTFRKVEHLRYDSIATVAPIALEDLTPA